jgi:septum formation protein
MELTGLRVTIAASAVDESRQHNESPRAMTERLAMTKAKSVHAPEGWVLGADTVVAEGDKLLGKPKDRNDARQMLESLRGSEHRVVTSIALLDLDSGRQIIDSCESTVPMRVYTESELDRYLDRGNPYDKAGSYAIQDHEFMPVDVSRMRDCFANVMGLPLCHVARNLPQAPPADVPAACQAHTGYRCPIYQEVLEGYR